MHHDGQEREGFLKEIAIVADLHHASPRMVLLAKYLRKRGVNAIIITPPLSRKTGHIGIPEASFLGDLSIIETNEKNAQTSPADTLKRFAEARNWKLYRLLKPILRFLNRSYLELRDFPDREKAWKKDAIQTFEKLLANRRIVAIVSSSSPATCHVIGNELSKKYGLPWIADLRDLWSQNHNYPHSRIRWLFERSFERRTLQGTSCIVTVTPDWAQRLKALHRRKDIVSITNGYDPETRLTPPQPGNREILRMVYTGQIYPQKQDLGILLGAISQLLMKGAIQRQRVRLDFYGRYSEELQRKAAAGGLADVVVQHGAVPWNQVQKIQSEADILLLFYWSDTNEKGWIPSKVFEYLVAGRPILATGNSNDNIIARIIGETKTGSFCTSAEEAAATIETIYGGMRKYAGDMQAIKRYGWDYLAEQYLGVIERITGSVSKVS